MTFVGALFVCAPTAASEDLTLKPFVGVNLGSQYGFVDLDDAEGRVQPVFGGAVGWEWPHFVVELELSTSPKFLTGRAGLIETGRLDTLLANANWLLLRPSSNLRPYVSVGAGALRVTFKDALDAFTSISTLAAGNVGGGVLVATRTRARLIADVRYVRSRDGNGNRAALDGEYVSYWRASGGVLLRF